MLNTGISLQRLATKAGVGFTPKKLFSNGEAGVWYDPSDVEASLTWRRNLFEYTESFDNSYWSKTGLSVTANNATAPDGSTTADKVTVGSGGHLHFLGAQISPNAGRYSFSMHLKAGTSNYAGLRLVNDSFGNDRYAVIINLSTGSFVSEYVVGNPPFKEYEIANAGNGWYRLTIKLDHYTSALNATLFMDDGNANWDGGTALTAFSGNGTDNFLVWGAQLEEGSTATEYQPIRTTFDNTFKQAFPKHTLYQDIKGVTPVSGLGQAVGLMLDKSEGIALGNELVTNGDFSNGTTGWSSASSGVGNVVNGQLVITSNNPTDDAYAMSQSFTVVQGESYKVSANLVSTTGSSIQCRAGSTNTSASYGTLDSNNSFGNVSMIVVPTTSTMWITLYGFGAGDSATFDDISVKKVSGSHATQSDSTKRPVFARHPERGRVNLLKYTEEFDNGVWGKGRGTVQANTATAPDGTDTADTFTENTDNGSHYVVATLDCSPNTTFSASGYVKDKSTGFAAVGLQQNTSGSSYIGSTLIHFNLSTGTHTATANGGTEPTNISYSSESVGNGWYRIQVKGTLGGTAGKVQMFLSPSTGTTNSYQGDGSSGIYIWGAQLEEANEATGYQKVVDDYDITESGYKSVYYLQFDGVNDTMTVQPVTSTIAPISVFMGHDTEGNTSTSGYFLDIESGRFLLAGAGYYTTASNWQNGTNIDATAKGVSTVVSDGTNADYRRDGIVERTGALANVPIEGEIAIFSRYDYTTQLTNGNMYQLVIRGATSTDKEIDQAEEFVAIKTGLKSEVVGLATLDLNFGANTYTARNSNGSVL